MYILGLNVSSHDSTAALLRDGRLRVMVEQERLSRRKRAVGQAPTDAVAACLAAANLTLDDVDAIAVGWDTPRWLELEGLAWNERRWVSRVLPTERFERRRTPPIYFVPHHRAHAASGYWTSGFERAAILVADGRGETQATSLAIGEGGEITVLREWDVLQSLGHLYGLAASWTGLDYWDGGKLMGLAAYGRATQALPLQIQSDGYGIAVPDELAARWRTQPRSAASPPRAVDYVTLLAALRRERAGGDRPKGHPVDDPRRVAELLRELLTEHFERWNYPFCRGDGSEPMAYADFAASVQSRLEAVVLHLAALAREWTGAERLVLAGGVAMNCSMIGRIARSGLFREVFVPPVPHDAGVSLGAALEVHRRLAPGAVPPPRLEHAYWAPSADTRAIGAALTDLPLPAARVSEAELIERVAAHIEAGRLVGWFQGRAEIGQRALGARSILGDPRRRSQLTRLNAIKGREVWRPLAPSVLADYADDVFGGKLPPPADFMLAACPLPLAGQRCLPATTHVDGTARPQVVRADTNPRFWRLIDRFRERTGVPAVINTSFNLAGEPIVYSPRDALQTFLRSDLDVLALDDYLIEKPAAEACAAGRVGRPVPRERPPVEIAPLA